MSKKNVKYVVFFLSLTIITSFILEYLENTHRSDILRQEREVLSSMYDAITKSHKTNAEIFFSTTINTQSMLDIMKKANNQDKRLRDEARQELYALLKPAYNTMKLFRIRQLHFHLPNNDSFLRFHKPDLYGDSLVGIRDTVAYVNKYKEPIYGFEEGRMYNGYRYIFPIIQDAKHYGSVEISVSTGEFLSNLRDSSSGSVEFIIKKDVVDAKVFKEQRSYYIPSGIDENYLYEGSISNGGSEHIEELSKEYDGLKEHLSKGEAFNFYTMHKMRAYITTYLPIINKYSNRHVAYFIISRPSTPLEYIMQKDIFIHIIMFVIIILVTAAYYNIQNNRDELNERNRALQKIQQIAKLGSWDLDAKSGEIHWSLEVYDIFDKDPKLFTPTYKAFIGSIHPDDVEKVQKAFADSIEQKSQYNVQHRVVKADGSFIHVNEAGYHKYDESGAHIKTIGTVHDVSNIVKYEEELNKVKNELESIVSHVPDIIFRCKKDDDLTMIYVNKAIENMTGYKAAGFINNKIRNYRSLIDEKDAGDVYEKMMSSLVSSNYYKLEYRITNSIGDTLWVQESGRETVNDEGEVIIEGIISDITHQKDSIDKLRKFIDIQDNIVLLTDLKKIIFANRKFFEFFGYKDLETFSQEHDSICNMFVEDEAFFNLKKMMPKEEHWIRSILNLPGRERVVSMVAKDGKPHAFSVAVNNYDPHTYVISFSDISDTMFEKLQLKNKAIKDQLTGAFNRVYFDSYIEDIIFGNKNHNNMTGIIMFDIDDFKKINDNYGHMVGDEVLKELVQTIERFTRKDDKLIRWGGEEFLVLMHARSIEDVVREAEHLRIVIQNNAFKEIGNLTCSFGAALHDEQNNIKQTIKLADDKLYEAKKGGKNQVRS